MIEHLLPLAIIGFLIDVVRQGLLGTQAHLSENSLGWLQVAFCLCWTVWLSLYSYAWRRTEYDQAMLWGCEAYDLDESAVARRYLTRRDAHNAERVSRGVFLVSSCFCLWGGLPCSSLQSRSCRRLCLTAPLPAPAAQPILIPVSQPILIPAAKPILKTTNFDAHPPCPCSVREQAKSLPPTELRCPDCGNRSAPFRGGGPCCRASTCEVRPTRHHQLLTSNRHP